MLLETQRTYAMEQQRARKRKAIVGAILIALLFGFMIVRTAERVGFARGYAYAMETITD